MPSHVENSSHLAEILRGTTIAEDEVLVSFDVKSLFTSVPVQPAIDCVKKILLADPSWALQSPISIPVILQLLTLCLEDTSFKFRNEFYEMTDGLAMGSPISPIVADIFMHFLEQDAIRMMQDRPRLWLRYVDDILAIVKRKSLDQTLKHLKEQNTAITFTMEVEKDGTLPFLDGCITRMDTRLDLTVYRKPTHSGRYLNFGSHHPFSAKCSTADALFSRAQSLVTDDSNMEAEFRRVTQELLVNGYPLGFITSRRNHATKKRKESHTQLKDKDEKERQRTVVIPFIDGVTQPLQRLLKPLNIRVVGKSNPWKWSLQNSLKDRVNRDDEPGAVYRIPCGDCDRIYIGETGRQATVRFKEHESYVRNGRFDMSAAAEHAIFHRHKLDFEHAKIIEHEKRISQRRVKEALHINAEKKNMNRDKGLGLASIWLSLKI